MFTRQALDSLWLFIGLGTVYALLGKLWLFVLLLILGWIGNYFLMKREG